LKQENKNVTHNNKNKHSIKAKGLTT